MNLRGARRLGALVASATDLLRLTRPSMGERTSQYSRSSFAVSNAASAEATTGADGVAVLRQTENPYDEGEKR